MRAIPSEVGLAEAAVSPVGTVSEADQVAVQDAFVDVPGVALDADALGLDCLDVGVGVWE